MRVPSRRSTHWTRREGLESERCVRSDGAERLVSKRGHAARILSSPLPKQLVCEIYYTDTEAMCVGRRRRVEEERREFVVNLWARVAQRNEHVDEQIKATSLLTAGIAPAKFELLQISSFIGFTSCNHLQVGASGEGVPEGTSQWATQVCVVGLAVHITSVAPMKTCCRRHAIRSRCRQRATQTGVALRATAGFAPRWCGPKPWTRVRRESHWDAVYWPAQQQLFPGHLHA